MPWSRPCKLPEPRSSGSRRWFSSSSTTVGAGMQKLRGARDPTLAPSVSAHVHATTDACSAGKPIATRAGCRRSRALPAPRVLIPQCVPIDVLLQPSIQPLRPRRRAAPDPHASGPEGEPTQQGHNADPDVGQRQIETDQDDGRPHAEVDHPAGPQAGLTFPRLKRVGDGAHSFGSACPGNWFSPTSQHRIRTLWPVDPRWLSCPRQNGEGSLPAGSPLPGGRMAEAYEGGSAPPWLPTREAESARHRGPALGDGTKNVRSVRATGTLDRHAYGEGGHPCRAPTFSVYSAAGSVRPS